MVRKTCSNKEAVAVLCDTIVRLAEINRSMALDSMSSQRRVIDRALAVCDFGLDAKTKEIEEIGLRSREAARPSDNGRFGTVPKHKEPTPDVFVPDGDPNG